MDEREQRVTRLTELAQRAFPGATISVEDDSISVIGPLQRADGRVWSEEVMRLNPHPRALDALEAALHALASEPPPWAVELADEWRGSARDYQMERDDATIAENMTLRACASELLSAAKGAPR